MGLAEPAPQFIDADRAIELLNEFLLRDPDAVSDLFRYRVCCNAELAAIPTIQVSYGPATEEESGASALDVGKTSLGLLGLLNGLFGVDDRGLGFIAAVYDDEGAVVAFLRTP